MEHDAVAQEGADDVDRLAQALDRLARSATPCSGSTCTRWLEPRPRMKRPSERSSTVAAAMAMVGALRTKTLLMLVPSRMRDVAMAQAARMANWSPPCPSAIQADS